MQCRGKDAPPVRIPTTQPRGAYQKIGANAYQLLRRVMRCDDEMLQQNQKTSQAVEE